VITAANVYDHERYWPAIVALTQEWLPPGETMPLKAQYRGTLVRVEADGRVRIDFGRHGRHDVPMKFTDLVERANQVRLGQRTKLAQNFVLRVGTRLLDASSPTLHPHKTHEIAGASAYLCIFADPRGEDFPSLARELAALDGENGVRTLFFPQSVGREDLDFVHERLGMLGWTPPFMYPRLSEGYTRSLLREPPGRRPRALLVSPEGRALYEAEVGRSEDLSGLRRAIERVSFPAIAAGSKRPE
jgi:hypothetical protein